MVFCVSAQFVDRNLMEFVLYYFYKDCMYTDHLAFREGISYWNKYKLD